MDFSPAKELPRELIEAALELISAPGRVAVLPMTGESMLPTLHPGQRVAVELDLDRPERGDLLLYRQLDYYVVHRYLGPASDEDGKPCLRTRGDRMPYLDRPLDPALVLGRVIAVERDGAWWDLDGAAARLYGLAAALHGLFWAAAAVVAGRIDALWASRGGRLRDRFVEWDRRLFALGHGLFLASSRRREAPPDTAPATGGGPDSGGSGLP